MTAPQRSLFLSCSLILTFFVTSAPCFAAEAARLVNVKKVWDAAPHSAFTDLVRFNDAFYVAFREGSTHVVPPVGQPGGDLRILKSTDGENWMESSKFVGGVDRDYRDAKLTIAPDGKLMLEGALAPHSAPGTRQSVVWVSDDGQTWSDPINIGDPNYWLWGVHTHGKHIYSIGYGPLNRGPASQWTTRLYRSNGDADFETFIPTFSSPSGSSEGSLLFQDDGTAVAIIRRDAGSQLATVGVSRGDFSEWTWKEANVMFGGPELIAAPDGRIIAGGRRSDGGARTSLNYLDPQTGTLTEFLTLPSGGDTSYPGMVWHDDRLWVSYYSSHEGKASIYVAQVEFVDESALPPIRHTGSVDPQSEGWIPQDGGVQISLNGPVNDGGLAAWAIHDQLATGGSREAWVRSLTAAEASAAATQGWRMKASVQVVGKSVVPDGAIELSVFPASDKGFMLWLGADAAGNVIVGEFSGKTTTGTAVRRTAILSGGYHDYEMAYDPAREIVDVYVDGSLVMENLVPVDREGAALNRILWGSNASAGIGHARYSFVEFSVGPKIKGDYDLNGSVDGADFLQWQREHGGTVFPGSGAEGDRSGFIDSEDLAVWTAAMSSAQRTLSVFEPATSWLALPAILTYPLRASIAIDACCNDRNERSGSRTHEQKSS